MKSTPLSRGNKQMKRIGFRKKEILESDVYGYDIDKTFGKLKRAVKKKASQRRVIVNKGYAPPKWFNSIKGGAHGQTPAQKKYWRLISIAVRVEDFELYGTCASCYKQFETWGESQAGHWKAWSVCHGFFKYERKNLAGQCAYCNHSADGEVSDNLINTLIQRNGPGTKEWIKSENEKHRGEKMEVWEIVAKAEPLYLKYKQYL